MLCAPVLIIRLHWLAALVVRSVQLSWRCFACVFAIGLCSSGFALTLNYCRATRFSLAAPSPLVAAAMLHSLFSALPTSAWRSDLTSAAGSSSSAVVTSRVAELGLGSSPGRNLEGQGNGDQGAVFQALPGPSAPLQIVGGPAIKVTHVCRVRLQVVLGPLA